MFPRFGIILQSQNWLTNGGRQNLGNAKPKKWIFENTEKEMALANYGEIMPQRSIAWTDAFADDKGKVRTDLPQTSWLIGFTGIDEGTRMTFNLHFNSKEEMNQLIEMGFEECFKMGLNQLEDILV